ncbi:DUF1553 domain-containing protein [Gemmata sp. G18]|uniref:DUF1553 domain-containing protein n=1 Tax=Gemmata palustris TaxID=2822762 RepID=A0ABS5BXW3_9BACT|nr:DUF1553 domain-containing protein [Gemmata palustris]MBP3958085.1 DUF1553 domain-containing protein [Gemmata palustris]
MTIFTLLLGATLAAPADAPARIEVYPTKVTLTSPRAVCQLVVTGHFATGETRDLTRDATFTPPAPVVEIRDGVVAPKKNGRGEIAVAVGGHTIKVPVEVSGQSEPDPMRFRTETLAVMTKQGCNGGSCHGSPEGKGGFRLSLFGYDPGIDAESLVRGGLNRRVDAFTPADSLVLKKPLMRVPHVGGKRLNKSDLGYRVLLDWIAQGAKTDDDKQPACVQLVVYPGPNRILRAPNLAQQLSVIAKFADGTTRDVTALATYEVSHKDVLSASDTGLVTGAKRGQGAVSVRYLNHLESVHFTMTEEVEGFVWNNPAEANFIDKHVHAKLNQLRVLPSGTCDDATFLRRVYLDLTGLLPPAKKAKAFLADTTADKRAKVIDELLASEEFARYWALRTADLMRVNSKTLPEGRAELLADWLVESYRKNAPFDKVATELLTATGDAAKVPTANYFLAIPNLEDLAETTAQLFMGSRVNCAKCHNHPFENWTQEDYFRIAAVFTRVKKTGKVVSAGTTGETTHPTSGKVLTPFGDVVTDPKADRRVAFARWLTKPGNPFFARVEVNRMWFGLFGRGIVHPVDDFRSSNPPAIPELLDTLASEFERSNFDRKHILRLMCNSRTYQRSTATNKFNETDDALFSRYPIRRLTAEQMQDAIGYATGSLAPPVDLGAQITKAETELAAAPADKAKQTALRRLKDRTSYATQRLTPEQSQFLMAFGQPKRESPCACERVDEPTVDQALQLLNGPLVAGRVSGSADAFAKLTDAELAEHLWLAAFTRLPNEAERKKVADHLKKAANRPDAVRDLVWAVINTREFLLQH